MHAYFTVEVFKTKNFSFCVLPQSSPNEKVQMGSLGLSLFHKASLSTVIQNGGVQSLFASQWGNKQKNIAITRLLDDLDINIMIEGY